MTGLTTVSQPGYDFILHHHFHQSCLHRILSNPEENQNQIDLAIQIADQLKADLNENKRKLEKIKRLKNLIFEDTVPLPPPVDNSDIKFQSRFELLKGEGSYE